jgi:hypothetical protein
MALRVMIFLSIVIGTTAFTCPTVLLHCQGRYGPMIAQFRTTTTSMRDWTALLEQSSVPKARRSSSWNPCRMTHYTRLSLGSDRGTFTALSLTPLDIDAESVVEVATEASSSWRQYVPLVVSGVVIIDILLGSPLANAVLSRVRPPSSDTDTKDTVSRNSNSNENRSAERIDSNKVAQEALQRAQYTLELRQFLQDRQSDADVYRDKQRQLEALEAELQRNQARLQDQMDQGKK